MLIAALIWKQSKCPFIRSESLGAPGTGGWQSGGCMDFLEGDCAQGALGAQSEHHCGLETKKWTQPPTHPD